MTIKSSNYENERNKIVNGDDMIVDVDAVAIEPVEDPEALVTEAVAEPVGTPERKPPAAKNNSDVTNSGGTNLSQFIVQAQPVGRQSDLFCGSCCDLVRATIIMDIIAIVVSVFNMCISLGWLTYVLHDASGLSIADHNPIFDSFLWAIGIVNGIGILVCIGSIYGALKCKKILVLFAGIYFIFTAICFIMYSLQFFIMSILFAYPHIALYRELKIGRITSENYAIEKYCCC